MATGLGTRIKRLESGHVPPCDGCGDDGDDSNVVYEVTWVDNQGDTGEPERCSECGRLLEYVVTWADDE